MKIFKKWPEQKWFSLTVALCIAIVFYLFLSNIDVFLSGMGEAARLLKPVIMGIVFAYIIDPLCKFYEKKVFYRIHREKLRHSSSVVAGLLTVLMIVGVILIAFIPQVVESLFNLFANAGAYTRVVQNYLLYFSALAESRGVDVSGIIASGNDMIGDMLSSVPDKMNGILLTSYHIGMGLADILIGLILAIYLLMDKDRMIVGMDRLMRALFAPRQYRRSKVILHRCNDILIRFVGFDLLDGLIIGCINWIFMVVMRLPYASLISVVVGVTNLAPTFGPLAGALIGACILLLESPLDALAFLIFTLILQILDGYVIKPKMFGSSLGVPSVWVLISLVVGGKLFGVIGILLGIPFAAIFSYMYDAFIDRMIEERKDKQLAKEAEPDEEKKEPGD